MKLKIGGHKYRVEYTNNSNKLDSDKTGAVDRKKGVIYIDKNLIQSEREATLLREIIHCINSKMGETEVEALAQQLYQVLKDNRLFECLKLKIGGHRYRIEYTNDRSKLDSDKMATIDWEKGIIYIDTALMKSEQEVSLLHEVFHIANGELEEELVDSLAQQLYPVLKDNEKLFEWRK